MQRIHTDKRTSEWSGFARQGRDKEKEAADNGWGWWWMILTKALRREAIGAQKSTSFGGPHMRHLFGTAPPTAHARRLGWNTRNMTSPCAAMEDASLAMTGHRCARCPILLPSCALLGRRPPDSVSAARLAGECADTRQPVNTSQSGARSRKWRLEFALATKQPRECRLACITVRRSSCLEA